MRTFNILLISFLFSSHLVATTYYVSPIGQTSATGNFNDPLSFTSAIGKSLAGGDSIILRGGIYNLNTKQTISKSGNVTKALTIVAYQAENPILDFRWQTYGSSYPGISLSGSYVYFKGITIQGAGDNGMIVTGSNNRIENCVFRWNCDSGLQMKTGTNNLILNCDSYENFDYQTGGTAIPNFGGNADGFADKQYTNTGGTNVYKACRSWLNSDDGWDSYEKVGSTEYDSCWCYANGPKNYDMSNHIRFKTDSASWFKSFKNAEGKYIITNYGNGNGFKLGGNYTANNALVRNCVAVKNSVKGFDQNNNNGSMALYNCTGYLNQTNYGFSNKSYGSLIIKNSASLTSEKSNSFSSKTVTLSNNTWSVGNSCSETDFVNLDHTQMLNNRQNDGSLPEISFLHLTSNSNLIDKGVDLGYTFVGIAPDLGAFEYESLSANPTLAFSSFSTYYLHSAQSIILKGEFTQVDVYDLMGVKVFSQPNKINEMAISTQNFKKGIYLVVGSTGNQKQICTKVLVN